MAWNFDHSFTAPVPSGAADLNRGLAGGGAMVWAMMAGASSHTIKAYNIGLTYMNKQPDSNYMDVVQQGSLVQVTEFTSLVQVTEFPDVGYASTIASDGDVAYVGTNSVSMSSTVFDTIRIFYSWGEKGLWFRTPRHVNSNIVVDNGKLWMTSYDIDGSYQQQLMAFDLKTWQWSFSPIPVKHQLEPRYLSRDHNGHILLCDYNNLSITKFTNSGVFVSTTRLAASAAGANREPNYITIGDDRSVYVASFQGMISKYNPQTDVVTSFSNGLGDIHSFVDDGTHLWVAVEKRPMSVSHQGSNYTCVDSHMSTSEFDVTKWALGGDGAAGPWAAGNYYVDDKEDLVRITKANNRIRHFGSSDRDIKINNPGTVALSNIKVNSVLVTPSYVCATSTGNVTIPKYVWAITDDNKIVAFPITAMHRPNYYQLNAVAMMSFGPYDYIGE